MSDSQSTETFRLIEGFPSYRVSDAGRVQSRRRQFVKEDGEWHDLKPVRLKHGHCCVRLYRDHARYFHYVHRLVLEAFVGPCPPGMECCHGKAGVKDNSLANLRWDTHKENVRDFARFGGIRREVDRKGEAHGMARLNEAQVTEIRRLRATGVGLRTLSEQFGVTQTQICRIAKGQSWAHSL